jgi:flagellar hook-associated protein 2
MAGINFGGLASGLDTNLIIESLLTRQQQRADAISQSIADGNTKKSVLNSVKSALSSFDDILGNLDGDVFGNRNVTSADDSIITATADAESELGEHELKVNNLAQRSVVTVGLAQSSATDVIGAGTLSLAFEDAANDLSVTLSDGNSTLTDLKTAINEQHGDTVQASIIEVSSGSFQLVLSAKDTGQALNIKDETDGASSSTVAGFDTTFRDVAQTNSGGVARTQDGEDASIDLDGITITRASNEIDDVLNGVTLTLKKESTETVNLKVESNFDDLTEGLQEFTDGYNKVLSEIAKATNPETGILKSDPDLNGLVRNFQSKITRFVSNIDTLNPTRANGDDSFTSLSQIGFQTDRKTGELSFDKEELTEALETSFTEVKNLFLGGYTSSNANITATHLLDDFSETVNLDIDSLEATIDGTTYSLTNDNGTLSFADGSGFESLFFYTQGQTGTATIDFAAGLSGTLEAEAERYSSFSGIIADRTTRIDETSRRLDKDLVRAQDRIDAERTRLTATFARAEQAINSLQALSSSLGTQSQGFQLG